jgi:hypothetical protein
MACRDVSGGALLIMFQYKHTYICMICISIYHVFLGTEGSMDSVNGLKMYKRIITIG